MKQIIDVTTVIFIKGSRILLGMKKRGFGANKYNGFGGKVKPGETVYEGAVRECVEESGLKPVKLEKMADIDFGLSYRQLMHVYVCREWEGEVSESDEMKPVWFDMDKIPYENMWKDDIYWLPLILQNKKIKAKFIFQDDNDTLGTDDNGIVDFEITEVSGF